MNIVSIESYRKVKKHQKLPNTAFADNDNTGGRLQVDLTQTSIFRLVSGEQLIPIRTDSGIVVKVAAGYTHRFE